MPISDLYSKDGTRTPERPTDRWIRVNRGAPVQEKKLRAVDFLLLVVVLVALGLMLHEATKAAHYVMYSLWP